jgi:phosphotransferase system enzyme I (PtsI)
VETTLRGIGVSPGIAIGAALRFDQDRFHVPRFTIPDPEAELARVDKAIEHTRDDLSALYRQTAASLGRVHADIFQAHLMLLDDVALRDELTERIRNERVNAEFILDDLSQRYVKVMEGVEDARFRERTADLLDVVNRLFHHLTEAKRPNLRDLSEPCILVAHDLSPSDTATMNLEFTLALAMDMGSRTSHTAILARALEIPAVVGLTDISTRLQTGVMVVVDGSEGLVIVDPTPDTLRRYGAARDQMELRRNSLAQAAQAGPCKTADGLLFPAYANIELPVEIPHSLKARAEGIGLYRTEYLYLNRETLPSEEEQYQAYAAAAEALNPMPVIIRTIDIGGDKLVSHLQFMHHEENPQLGCRAVRFCLQHPELFRTQLRAILRASVHGNVLIMFPMISGLEELRQVKAMLWQERDRLKLHRIPFRRDIKVGSMIEVPSAVALIDLLAKECDFFSIGTNDLIQYSLAVDRVNEKIAHLYEPAHPAVLRMIRWTANAAKTTGIPCGICGEMAGDPLYTEILLGLGVSSLSMSSVMLPVVRAEIAQTTSLDAQALAQEALKLSTAEEVRALLTERFERKGGVDAYLSMRATDADGATA